MFRICPPRRNRLAYAVAVLGYSLPGATQTPGLEPGGDARTRAEVLDEQGMTLLKEGRYPEACPRLAESYRIRPGTGVLMRLALCHEQLGNTASAWHAYLDAAARARQSSDITVEQLAQKRAAALEPRLSHVTLQLDQSAKEAFPFTVTCDGSPVARNDLGGSLALDPGLHVIVATARGRKQFVHTVRIGENGATSELTISLPELPSHPPLPLAESKDRDEPVSQHQPTTTSADSAWSTQHTAAVIAGGVGVAGLAVGTFFGLRVAAKMSDARDRCGGESNGCPPESLALQDQSRDAARLSTVAFTAGALGIAGGAVLWLTTPDPSKASSNVGLRVGPMLGHGNAGLVMAGQL